ncbi:hypothetical protein CHARACLAT_015166 [Characodon lateralis]|uniref:Secreted protein n=1 Tax=Characodon lateralis TaxID=208331 RepID=A0ABU7E0Z9_9TELE|nr:hypothetical protein [Characodon lateralis]
MSEPNKAENLTSATVWLCISSLTFLPSNTCSTSYTGVRCDILGLQTCWEERNCILRPGVKVSRYGPVLRTTKRFCAGMQYREKGRAAVCYEALIQNLLRLHKSMSTQKDHNNNADQKLIRRYNI